MKGAGAFAAVVLAVVLSVPVQGAQNRSRYREFTLGTNVDSVAALTGTVSSQATVIHERPALMQELTWQRPYSPSDTPAAQRDPVKQIVFSFYDGQLSRMVVDYDRDRTIGMSNSDLIDAISLEYGPPSKPSAKGKTTATSRTEQESGTAIARWVDDDGAVVLYRSPYGDGFRLIVTSPSLDHLAQVADARAVMLDEREAPSRESARQKKQADDERAAKDQARSSNKAAFRP